MRSWDACATTVVQYCREELAVDVYYWKVANRENGDNGFLGNLITTFLFYGSTKTMLQKEGKLAKGREEGTKGTKY